MIQQKVKKKNKAVLMHHFQYSQSKTTGNKGVFFCNKICSLKSLAILKCESKTSPHAVQYK